MKKKEEQTFKRQIFGGVIYTALAVTVTAVAVGGITSAFRRTADNVRLSPLPSSSSSDGAAKHQTSSPKQSALPDAASFTLDTPLGGALSSPVTDIEQGVDASLTKKETVPQIPEAPKAETEPIPELPQSDPLPESPTLNTLPAADRSVPVSEEPEEEYAGYGGYIRPCGGYVSREYAPDTPIYSPTMLDYRTHAGVDIACDIGTPVRAVAAGVIKEIADDALFGTTMVIAHEDGVISVYANLSPDLPTGIAEGTRVIAGDVIAGVGESAACECAEVSHLHLELWREAKPVDPATFLP